MEIENCEAYLKGSIIGLLIGDTISHSYKNQRDNEIGIWTFPGSFSLATMASINDCDQISEQDIIEKFNDVYIGDYLCPGECKNIGPITSEAISNFTNGLPPDKCGITECSENADCLLRILPIGLYLAPHPIEEIVDQAHKICSITHNDTCSQIYCALFCLIIRNILLQKGEKAFDILEEIYTIRNYDEHKSTLRRIKEMRSKPANNSNNINDVLWSAWSIFASHENDFEASIINSIQLGGDTNGRTSIIGSISGLSNGFDNIPQKWINNLHITGESIDVIRTFINSVLQKIS